MAYEVKMRCEVTKLVTCEGCTRKQAEENPWDFATDEIEIDQINWKVESVKEVISY